MQDLQLRVFGEMSDLNSLLFFIGVTTVCWWLTGSKKLRAARLWTVGLAFGNLAIERMHPRYPEMKSYLRGVLVVAIGIALRKAHTEFVDFERVNNTMLARVVNESVDKTPVWFGKFKAELLSTQTRQLQRELELVTRYQPNLRSVSKENRRLFEDP